LPESISLLALNAEKAIRMIAETDTVKVTPIESANRVFIACT